MITIDALLKAQQAYKNAWNYYLSLCNQNENRMVRADQVKAAHARAQKLEAEYNAMWLNYQAQSATR